tara:strand:- start:8940 stop:10421 length:1482 start_codon:yes stop_codon:yes gene_type:complete
MTEKVTQQQLKKYLWGAATLLRGVIDPGEYKNIIFPLMFFKRISDVYDEEYKTTMKEFDDKQIAKSKEFHRFIVPNGSHWKNVREITNNVGKEIRKAMDSIEKANPDKFVGIFGDANWSNKDRLSDRIMVDLIEHFSTITLSVENVPQDEFGNAYEFLIKKFADDSGHNAAEFYTNRTVVRLMTLIVDPQPNESIYDPTCGSGGMLLNARLLVKEKGKEYRNIKLYGQEINNITSAIAKMNMFIHGVEDFSIVREDTLANPAFIEGDKVQQFDICLANPPYSIKKWNRNSWMHDPYGRNIYGTPPQGCADYAFFQHIICSLKEKTGRCAILWPHGILFRDAEQDMRSKLVESDVVDCVIGLGKNLFYNSVMESCIVVCNKNKPKERKGKVLFINGINEVIEEKQMAFLSEENIKTLFELYRDYKDIPKLSHVVTIKEIAEKDYSLNVPFYVQKYDLGEIKESEKNLIAKWEESSNKLKKSTSELFSSVKEVLK